MSFDYYDAVASLRADWPSLSDVDRAERISPILDAGTSSRTLAKAIHRSDALLRHIRPLLEATAEEKALARAGGITTKALLRIIKKRRKAGAEERAETPDLQPEHSAETWANCIANWATSEFGPRYGKQVVAEARRRCKEFGDKLVANANAAKGLPLEEIISRCRPVENGEFFLESDSVWLTRWILYAITQPTMRELALAIADERMVVPNRRREITPAA